jgi:hypothetical protein
MLKSRYLRNEFRNTTLKRVLKGSESWSPTKGDQQKLKIFEGKVLKNIYRSIRENEGWRIKYSYELYDLYCP